MKGLGKALLVLGGHSPPMAEEGEEYGEGMEAEGPPLAILADLETVMGEFLTAVEAKDARGMAVAIHSAICICERGD